MAVQAAAAFGADGVAVVEPARVDVFRVVAHLALAELLEGMLDAIDGRIAERLAQMLRSRGFTSRASGQPIISAKQTCIDGTAA